MPENTEKRLVLQPSELLDFCGQGDEKIRHLRSLLDAQIVARGNELVIRGSYAAVDEAVGVVKDLLEIQRQSGRPPSSNHVLAALRSRKEEPGGEKTRVGHVLGDVIAVPDTRRRIAPMTAGQKRYVDAIRKKDVVFAIGPAGTGKTYLAVAMAVSSLVAGDVRRIILVRPAVEAGERLGFLPGDIGAKFDPFVRPLYDALYDMMEPEKVKTYLETGIIEVAPLAFMRGRTLNDAFVILDEGQNTTASQMKMFLTRLGAGSKAVITGDITQIDLPPETVSGLVHAQKILRDVRGIGNVRFKDSDVVRHDLVQRIVRAYESHQERRKGKGP
jgi:phosphate starvation-inducible protein PhoH and related proteins